MQDSDEPVKDSDLNKMVTKFTLMCPGISMSTLTHGLSLHGSQSFEEMCNQLTTTIDYDDPPYSDVEVSDNKLVRRSNDNGQYSKNGKWYSKKQVYMPNIEMRSNLVGDTELISTFIDKYKLNVNWRHRSSEGYGMPDLSLLQHKCDRDALNSGGHCVSPYKHLPWYIWTRYPQEISELAL